jgi:hypothetical protein
VAITSEEEKKNCCVALLMNQQLLDFEFWPVFLSLPCFSPQFYLRVCICGSLKMKSPSALPSELDITKSIGCGIVDKT